MEAINGLDLFGSRGGPSSVINVLHDEVQQCNVSSGSGVAVVEYTYCQIVCICFYYRPN